MTLAAWAALISAMTVAASCSRQSDSTSSVAKNAPVPTVGSDSGVAPRLVCPDRVEELRRTAASPDGRSCRYQGVGRSEDVILSRLLLNGSTPTAALLSVEADLRRQVGAPAGEPKGLVSVQAHDVGGDDHAKVDLPGLHINAGGDHAQVRLLGFSINADGDHARVQTGHGGTNDATVDAGPGGAVVRTGRSDSGGTAATFVLASDSFRASGYKAVGYIARGPASGPLVVATFKSDTSDGQDHGGGSGVQRLLDLNVRR